MSTQYLSVIKTGTKVYSVPVFCNLPDNKAYGILGVSKYLSSNDISKYLNSNDISIGLSHILAYYTLNSISIQKVGKPIVWILYLELKPEYRNEMVTTEMAYNFNRDLEYFMDGNYPNIGYQGFNGLDPLLDSFILTISFPDKEEG